MRSLFEFVAAILTGAALVYAGLTVADRIVDPVPLLIDGATVKRAGGDWCDINPQTQAEPLERPRGVILGEHSTGDIA